MISSRRNPLVRRLRKLSTKEGREEHCLLLLEGTHLLQEALRTAFKPNEIVATTHWLKDHQELLNLIPSGVQLVEVTPAVLKASLTTVQPDGVASLFSIDALPKCNHEPDFVLALDRLQDPGNLGNLLRTALAADVEIVWLASGVDPLNSKVIRASAGAVLHLPLRKLGASESESVSNLQQKLQAASEMGKQVVGAMVPGASSIRPIFPYWEIDWRKPTVLVLGNEGSGLNPCLQACCTHLVTLPHGSKVESLNVASAAVPLLMERRRAKMTN